MGYTPKPPTSIQFTDYVWVYEKSDALSDLLKRSLTDDEKEEIEINIDADIYLNPEYPSPDVENVTITYQSVDITELWDKPEKLFFEKVVNEIERQYC